MIEYLHCIMCYISKYNRQVAAIKQNSKHTIK